MSYLLNHRSTGGGAKLPHRILPLRSTGLSAQRPLHMGRGQLQIQRLAAPQQQQSQHQSTQGVISMEEVIADLRILEEQQVESVRKLEQARATKQRRLEHQAALEAQLGKLLYENGQRRAELEHVYQQLAQGQREMNELRLHVDKSGDDLRDYDAKLQYALDLKSWIQGYCRTQDRWMERARNKVANRRRRLEVLHGKCKASNGKLQSKREFEESLRRGLRDEANKQRQIAECKTCIRVECAELEKQCHHAIKQVTFLKSTDESLSEKINVEVQRERIGKADFEKQQNTHQSSMLAMSQSKKVTSETTAQNQSDLHDIWLATIAIQEQEGHTPSQSPSLSSQLPILDLNRIRRSVQVEIDAAAKETLAKDLLGDTVTKLQSELVDLETNQACANEELLAKNEKNETSARIEEERKESIDEVLAEHHMIDAKIGEKTLKVRQLQKEKDASLETTRVASLAIAEGVENADIQYQELRTQLSDVQSKMDIAHAEYDHAKLADPKMIFNLQLQLQETSQRRLEIQKETELFQKGHIATAEQQRLREQMEKANRTIADKLEAFPQLANISFQYREDLDDQGQGKIDLKRLVLECRSRQSKAEANYENLKERKKAQRSKKDLVVNDPKQIVQLEKIKATKPVASIVDQPEGKVVSKEGIAVVVHDVVSVVKPRSLLASFSRVAEESDGAPDGLNANFDIDVVIRNQHNSGQTEVCDVVSDAKPRVLLSSFQCVTKASNREPNDLNGSFDSDVASRDELNRRIEMVSMNQSKDSDMDSDVDILTEVTNQANATVSDEATQRNRRAALSHDKKVRWLDDLDELGSEDAIEIKSKSARSLKQKGKFGAAVKTNDFGRVKGQSKTLGGGVPKRGSFDVERKHLEKKDRYKVSNRTNADERDHGKTVNVSLAKHDSKWGQDSSKVSLAKHDSMWDQDSSKVQVNEAGTSPRSRHIVVHSERKHIEKKDRNNVSYRTNAGEWDHGTTVKPSLAQHDSKSGQHSFKAKANETSKSPRGRHDAVCSSHLIRKQPAVATRFEKRNDSSNLGEDKATSRIRSKSSMVNETKKRKSSSHRADSPSHFHANEQENPMSRSHAGHKKDLDGIGKPFQSFQNNQEYSRSTEMLKTNKATIRSDHIIKTKKHANSMPVKTTDRTSVNIDKSAPKTSLFLEETRGKRTSEQTSGIPSQERAPKSRRRARSVPSTATSKPGLADFEDYTFNFGA